MALRAVTVDLGAREASAYAALKRRVRDAGLLERQPWFYARSIGVKLAALSACIAVFVLFRNPWLQAANAVALAVISAQLGFQLHDAGHRQMFAKRWKNELVGLLTLHAVLCVGFFVYFIGPWSALLVIVMYKCLGGAYLALVFAPNHKGMPQVDSHSELDFLERQVLTSRNVRSHPLTDVLYGA